MSHSPVFASETTGQVAGRQEPGGRPWAGVSHP